MLFLAEEAELLVVLLEGEEDIDDGVDDTADDSIEGGESEILL